MLLFNRFHEISLSYTKSLFRITREKKIELNYEDVKGSRSFEAKAMQIKCELKKLYEIKDSKKKGRMQVIKKLLRNFIEVYLGTQYFIISIEASITMTYFDSINKTERL